MIPKKKEDYLFHDGEGRPHMLERKPPLKDDAERNRAVIIDLEGLNEEGKAPVNFSRKAGRNIGSFVNVDDDDAEGSLEIE